MLSRLFKNVLLTIILLGYFSSFLWSQSKFKVIAFFTARNDLAHISFLQEANRWFARMASTHEFTYDSTNDWKKMNDEFLSRYQVVIFLDTRPEEPAQRAAFRKFIEHGGGWMGFHFAGFALNHSEFPQDWDWYHNEFIGAGQFVSNTWRPTSAILKVEAADHPAMKSMPPLFRSSPNEWYRWEKDLTKNPDIRILASIDPSSYPLGTGPKQDEIWREGYYPVIWTNKKFRMIYYNMGHNDIDYEGKTNRELSHQFGNPLQDQLILDGLLWLGKQK